MSDLYWLAGLLEGEGSFTWYRWKDRPLGYPKIQLVSTDHDIMERAGHILKTPIYGPYKYGTNKKVHWTLGMTGSRAAGWMMTLFSLMGQRRQNKIAELLAKWRER